MIFFCNNFEIIILLKKLAILNVICYHNLESNLEGWKYMTTIRVILGSMILVIAVAVIVCIMILQGKSKGLGAIDGSSTSDSYYSKNKGRTRDSIFGKITIVLSIVLVILILALDYAILV